VFHHLEIFVFICQCEADTEERKKRLDRKKTDAGERNRVQHKINRTEEQALRYCGWQTLISCISLNNRQG